MSRGERTDMTKQQFSEICIAIENTLDARRLTEQEIRRVAAFLLLRNSNSSQHAKNSLDLVDRSYFRGRRWS